MEEKYGNRHTFSNKCILEKAKKTINDKYGVDNVFQCKEVKIKLKETKLEKYGDENFNNRPKSKKSNIIKYGCSEVLQNEGIRLKGKNTWIEKYGVAHFTKNSNWLKNHCIKNGFGIYRKDLSEWKLYSRIVRMLTNKEPIHLLENIEKRGSVIHDNAYHLDHIVSITDGFKYKIFPDLIASISNLKMIPAIDNIRKKTKSEPMRLKEIIKLNDELIYFETENRT